MPPYRAAALLLVTSAHVRVESAWIIGDPTNHVVSINNSASGDSISDDLGYLYRASRKTAFCEVRWGGLFRGHADVRGAYFPEIGSIISAPWISFFGLHMLLFWRHDSNLLHMICGIFMVNGIGSFLFHYSGLSRWGDLDNNSMLMCTWAVSGFVLSEVTEAMQAKKILLHGTRRGLMAAMWMVTMLMVFWVTETNAVAPSVSSVVAAHSNDTTTAAQFGGGQSAVAVDVAAEGIYAIADPVTEYGPIIGPLAMALPLAFTIILTYVAIHKEWVLNDYMPASVERIFRRRLNLGVGCVFIGAPVWLATELTCDSAVFFRWLPGHLIWHISMGYGLLNCLFYAATLRSDNQRAEPRMLYCGDSAWYIRAYFSVFPAMTYEHGGLEGEAHGEAEAGGLRKALWRQLTKSSRRSAASGLSGRPKVVPVIEPSPSSSSSSSYAS
jgi:hypothetical protein